MEKETFFDTQSYVQISTYICSAQFTFKKKKKIYKRTKTKFAIKIV